MNSFRLPEKVETWAPWALLLAPAALLGSAAYAVIDTYSPTPYMDQWAIVALWRKAMETGLTPGDLVAQHNEHRILLPRLVFLADYAWFSGRNVLNLIVIGLIQVAAAALFVRACGVRRPGPLALLAMTTAAGLMFSLQQWENLFWGFQVQFVGVFAAGGWAIYLFCAATADRGRTRWPVLAAAFGLLAIATFNLANGLFAGLAMAATAIASRRDFRPALAALGVTAALLAAYLVGYQPVEHHAPASLALEHPGRFIAYVLAYLGGPWSLGRIDLALFAGAAGVVATFAMAAAMFWGKIGDPGRSAMFGIVLFIGATAALTALGRLNFGLEQALSPRYATPVGYFWAAHVVFWILTAQASRSILAKAAIALPVLLAYAALIPLHVLGYAHLLAVHERILLGSSAILNDADDPEALRHIYPDPTLIRELAPFLREQRLSLFAEAAGKRPGEPSPRTIAPRAACRGAFEVLEAAPGGTAWRAAGWGWDAAAGRTVAKVVLADGAGRVAGVALGGALRTEATKVHPDIRSGRSGWTGSLPRSAGRELVAYGLLADGRACELGRRARP